MVLKWLASRRGSCVGRDSVASVRKCCECVGKKLACVCGVYCVANK